MTVSPPKRSVLNVNFAYTAEYGLIDNFKRIINFPSSDQFSGPYVIKWPDLGVWSFVFPQKPFTINAGASTSYVNPYLGDPYSIQATDPRIVFSFNSGQAASSFWNIHAPDTAVIYRLEDEADYLAGKMWRRGYLQTFVDLNPGAIRFMNWWGGHFSNQMRWENRALVTDRSWTQFITSGNIPTYGTTSGTNQYTLVAIGSTPASMRHGEVVQCTIGNAMVRCVSKTITSISKAANGRVVATAHGFLTGDVIVHRITGGMVELDSVPCTITKIDADTYDTNVNTGGFTTFTAGSATQYITLQVGSGSDRVAYPVVYEYGNLQASTFFNAMGAGETHTFHFDKTMKSSTTVNGCWIWKPNTYDADQPFEVILQFMKELNDLASAQGKGPIHCWINIPHRGLCSMDPDYSAGSSICLSAVGAAMNGLNGYPALPTGVMLIVENSNETWNTAGGFYASVYYARRAALRWGTTYQDDSIPTNVAYHQFATLRACVVANDIRTAFPTQIVAGRIALVQCGWGTVGLSYADGILNRLRLYGSTQLSADSLYISMGGGQPMSYFDAFGTASYFGAFFSGYDTANLATLAAAYAGGDQSAITTYVTNGLMATSASVETVAYYRDLRLPEYAAALLALGKFYIGYEGGEDWGTTGNASGQIDTFLLAVRNSPQWATAYRTYLDAFKLYTNAFLPPDYIMVGDRWGHCTTDPYANGVYGAALDLAWFTIRDFNNPATPVAAPTGSAQNRRLGPRPPRTIAFGATSDPPATDPDAAAAVIPLLKGWLAALPPSAPDPPVPTSNRVRVPAAAFGSPEDDVATSTTAPWSAVALLKGILNKLT